jgi:hypothetical protein
MRSCSRSALWLVLSALTSSLGCSDAPADPAHAAGSASASGSSQAGGGGTGAASSGGAAGASGTAAGTAGASAGAGGTGVAGTGGATAGTGGAAAGTSGAAGAASGGTTGASCSFEVDASVSSKIPTVGIVSWSSSLASIESAVVEFGLDTTYGMTAPVDLTEPEHRTLLLGMKASRDYHLRVVATANGQRCESQDFTLATGPVPNGVPAPDVETSRASELQGGYLVTARWGFGNGGPAVILDADGDLVWWYAALDDVIRARFSFDGKAMWIRNTAQMDGIGEVLRVSLDGLEEESWDLPRTTHDLAVIPDGHLGLIAHAENGCDEIVDFDPADGSLTSLFNAEEAHGETNCHVNYLAYHAEDDSFVFSDWANDALVKITRAGELVWVLNGAASDFTGTSWTNQHGVHLLSPNHLLVFSNGPSQGPSLLLEYQLDPTSGVATELFRYDADINAQHGGDVQRLDNGNTLVTYSSAGVIHEINPAGDLVQSLEWSIDGAVSYAEKRMSLYGGPPPKIYEHTASAR